MIRRRAVDFANEIRMRRSQHAGAFLIVEGRDDRLLYERFVNSSSCKIVVVEGKPNACQIIDILDRDKFAGIVAVVDADFDRIERRTTRSANIVLTDFHDLECMLVRSSAFEFILVEFASREKLERFGCDPREAVLKAALPAGCLRLHSERAGLNLRFANMNYSCFLDQQTLAIDLDSLVREVLNRSQRQDLAVDHLKREVQAILSEGHELWDLCTGEDVLGVLSVGLRRAFGTNSATLVGSDVLRRALRLAHAWDHFRATTVFKNLCTWEASNPSFCVLEGPAPPSSIPRA